MRQRHEITFGTDGWRGIIGADFTLRNVRRISSALAECLISRGLKARPVVIGYDNRFLSERCALEAARPILDRGISVSVSRSAVPTPALSLKVIQARASAGIMITASHNAPEFNGLKLKAEFGGSALPELTGAVQRLAIDMDDRNAASLPDPACVPREDLIAPYVDHLTKSLDVDLMRRNRRKLLVDSMHGVGSRIIEELLSGKRCHVSTIHSEADPCFGGIQPEPLEKNLIALARMVKREGYDLGVATDGDADRVAAIAEDGSYLSPLTLTPLLALHLLENRKRKGSIVKTYANTIYLDRIAHAYSLPFFIRPVGFKYVAEIMLKGDFLIGGEESGGIGIGGYIPERDGLFVSLLLFEMLCQTGFSITQLKKRMWKRFGKFEYRREDLLSQPEIGKRLTDALVKDPPDKLAGYSIESIDTLDGIKFIFADGSWLLLRQSGTEPVLRIYAEATSRKKLGYLIRSGIRLTKRH